MHLFQQWSFYIVWDRINILQIHTSIKRFWKYQLASSLTIKQAWKINDGLLYGFLFRDLFGFLSSKTKKQTLLNWKLIVLRGISCSENTDRVIRFNSFFFLKKWTNEHTTTTPCYLFQDRCAQLEILCGNTFFVLCIAQHACVSLRYAVSRFLKNNIQNTRNVFII